MNTPGGIIDLRTGKIMDHDRSLGMTKIATATPVEDCPAWHEFLATVTNNDAELQAYLCRVAGYCLTGITREHALFFLYGTGANGKSVFVNTVSTIVGDYATTAPIDMFMAATGERHPTDMAGLRGARLVAAVETEQGRRWAESKLKALTGGDKITARFMRQDFFEFVPQFKLVIAGNHKPAIRNIDEAMRRRFHMIPFTVTIPPAKRDKTLTDRLLAERDGILAWAVEGCLEWQRDGTQPAADGAGGDRRVFRGRGHRSADGSPRRAIKGPRARNWCRHSSMHGRSGQRRRVSTSAQSAASRRTSQAGGSQNGVMRGPRSGAIAVSR